MDDKAKLLPKRRENRELFVDKRTRLSAVRRFCEMHRINIQETEDVLKIFK